MTVVEAAGRALGPVGVLLPVSMSSMPSVERQREAVHRLEHAGYRAAWTNEVVGGKDALVQLAILLAATNQMVFGTAITNMWARPPQTLHAAAALLAQAFPGRFVLGLGVGYLEQAASVGREFGSPVALARDYLDQMATPTSPPAPDLAYPKILGATGPKCSHCPAKSPTGVADHASARVHRSRQTATRPRQAARDCTFGRRGS